MKNRDRSLLCLLLAYTSLSGCAAPGPDGWADGDDAGTGDDAGVSALLTGDGEDDEVELGEQSQGLIGAATPFLKSTESHAELFYWKSNTRDLDLKEVSTHVCFLTRVSGNLGSGDSAVALHRGWFDVNAGDGSGFNNSNGDGPVWKLSGWQFNTPNSTVAEATCVPLADFKAPSGSVKTISKAYWREARTSWPGCNETKSIDMIPHAAAYITVVRGDFEGAGESVSIIQPEDSRDPVRLRIKTGQCGLMEASAHALFVGVPGEVTRPFLAARADLNSTSGEHHTKRLSRTRESVCYLTKVSGNLDGTGESIRIYPKKDTDGIEYWWFETKAQGGSAYGSVECIKYDQTPPIVY